MDQKFEDKPCIVDTKERQELAVKSDGGVLNRRKPNHQESEVQKTIMEPEKSEDAVAKKVVGEPITTVTNEKITKQVQGLGFEQCAEDSHLYINTASNCE